MKTYDAILVLGSQPDTETWQFPTHIYRSLDKALELYHDGMAPYIVLSGNHALRFDNVGIVQPFKEADKMRDYLIEQGCPPESLITESDSKDTLANYYNLKHQVFAPRNWRRILQVTTAFRVPRLQYLCRKVFGPDFEIAFQTVDFDDTKVAAHEAFVFQLQQEYLKDMKDGDDTYLDDYFYDSAWYRYWRQREQASSESSDIT